MRTISIAINPINFAFSINQRVTKKIVNLLYSLYCIGYISQNYYLCNV